MNEVNPNDPNPPGAKTEAEEKPVIDVNAWLQRISASEKYMRDYFKPKWDLARKRLRSEMYNETQKGGYPSQRQVNLLYSIGVNFVNSVFFKNPNCNFTAREEEDREKVENTEIKINDFLKDKKVKKMVKRIIWDAFDGGFGARYVDYAYKDQESQESALDDNGKPIMGQDGQPVMQRLVSNNQPIVKRVRPDLVRFPRGFDFDNSDDSPWVGFDLLVPVDEVKNNPDFSSALTVNIKGSKYDDISEKDQKNKSNKDGGDDLLWVRLHYVFEKAKDEQDVNKMLVLCSEVKEAPLQTANAEKGQVGYQLKFLYFNPLDDDCAYPVGDAWMLESQLWAVDRWWMTYVNHIKRILPKVIYDKNKVTGQDIQKLKESEDLQYVGIDPKGQVLANLFFQYEASQTNGDFDKMYEVARQIISEVGPKSSLSRGAQDTNVDTATAAKIVQANESIDIEGRIDDIREFFIDLVIDLAGLYEKNFQGVTQIKGKLADGTDVDRQVDKTGFTSKINADVDVESMQAPNKEVYRRQLIDTIAQLQALEPELNKKGKGIDFEFFINKLFDAMTIKNADKAIIDINMRDPAQEHQDAVFKGIPLQVQPGEDKMKHLKTHMETSKDPILMGVYEQLKPGFTDDLMNHILETQQTDDQGMPKGQGAKKPGQKPVSGQRDPMATELSRSNRT